MTVPCDYGHDCKETKRLRITLPDKFGSTEGLILCREHWRKEIFERAFDDPRGRPRYEEAPIYDKEISNE